VIPRHRTKGDREHVAPLPPLAQALIKRVEDNGTDLMFTSKRSITKAANEGRTARPLSGFSRSKARIDAVSGVSDWRLHDLRRTLRSGLARMRVHSDVARKVVNHKLVSMDEIYNRYQYLPERRSALCAWNNLVDGIINDSEASNVTIVDTREPSSTCIPHMRRASKFRQPKFELPKRCWTEQCYTV
jgi:integrase